MNPNELLAPPLYNQPQVEPEVEPVADDSDALAKVTKAYEEAKRHQGSYQELWRQLWLLWRFYRSADSAVKVFDPIGYAMVAGLLSKIFVQAPKVVLTAKNGKWKWLSKILQAYLEHQFDNPDSDDPMDEEFISFVTELLVLGTAVGKTSWCTKFITQYEEQTTIDPMTGMPKTERVAVEKKAFDDPIFEHIPREKFFIQPGAKTISESKYAIFEKDVNKSYLEDLTKLTDPMTGEPIYNIPEEALEAVSKPTSDDGGINEAKQPQSAVKNNDENEGWYQLLEYWEDDEYIVVLNQKWVIRGPEDNPNDDGKKPFIAMSYTKVPQMFDGIGALEPVMDLQRAQNITLTQRLEYVSNLLNQQFAVAGTLDANDEEALIEGYPIVHVQSSDAIQPLNKGSVPQAAFIAAGDIKGAMEFTNGISGYQLGAPNAAQDKTQGTLGGIQTIVAEAQTRFSLVLKRFEKVILKGIAKRFLDLDRQYFSETEQKIIQVTNAQETIPVPLTKELLLATDFYVDIVPGSTGLLDKNQKLQKFTAWGNIAMALPNFDRQAYVIEAGELAEVEQPERFILQVPTMPGMPGPGAPNVPPQQPVQ